MNEEISKKKLWKYLNIKIKRAVNHHHVFAIISILFEEMVIDLLNGKEIKIFNFGTLYLENTKPKKYHDVRFKKMMESKGNRVLKFLLKNKLKKKLISYLDVDTTLRDDDV